MSDKEVKHMLQRYMDGMTSVDEEARLIKYFSKADDKAAPEGISEADWQTYKAMFAMFSPAKRKVRVVGLWRLSVAAAILLLVVAGSWLWQHHDILQNTPNENYMAAVEKTDSIACKSIADTTAIDIVPRQEATPPAKKQGKIPTRPRHEPAVPRHYMAQAIQPEAIDTEEALRQAELLMQAVYLQQQNDVNSAMMQCTLVIEEEEDTY